jgi:cytochrome c biogenesis factor
MTKQGAAMSYRQERRAGAIPEVLGFGLPVIAVILACGINFFLQMPIPIETPAVLVLGAFFILAPFKSDAATTLQKITAFYLISVPVNELSSQYYSLSLSSVDVNVSYSAAVLLLCAIGYLLAMKKSKSIVRNEEGSNIIHAWVLALVVIVVHMALLSLILKEFYGYGYEHNLSVLGNLALFFLLFIVLWKNLDGLRFRQCVGVILTIFYLAVTVTKHGPQ